MSLSANLKILTRSEHSIQDKAILPDAWKVLRRLHGAGHTAYLVGGTVRDLFLGRQPKDFDVATTAKPNDIKRLFRNAFMIGRRFRLAHIKFYDNIIEVATFRQETDRFEEAGEDGGEPKAVRLYGTPEEDARRRDFTINGLFYDAFLGHVIDYVGGLADMEKRLVRTISPPDQSYEEDPARMVRAVRAAARLGFAVESDTREAILRHRESILRCPRARLLEELMILLKYASAERSMRLLWQFGLMEFLLPMHHAYLLRRQSIPLEPPKPDILFDLLSMFDLESSGAEPPIVFALLLLPCVMERMEVTPEAFWTNRKPGAAIAMIESVMDEFAKSVDISKRFRARAVEILSVQPRMILRLSNARPEKLASKPYFSDSLRFLQIAARALDLDVKGDLAIWEKHKSRAPMASSSTPPPGVGRQGRRRRRHGRDRSQHTPPPSSPSTPPNPGPS